MNRRDGFLYDLAQDCLRISVGRQLVVRIPYARVERVERGWAPGLQVGGPGMPDRGDEVRVRADLPFCLPWVSLTPAEPDDFVNRLLARRDATRTTVTTSTPSVTTVPNGSVQTGRHA